MAHTLYVGLENPWNPPLPSEGREPNGRIQSCFCSLYEPPFSPRLPVNTASTTLASGICSRPDCTHTHTKRVITNTHAPQVLAFTPASMSGLSLYNTLTSLDSSRRRIPNLVVTKRRKVLSWRVSSICVATTKTARRKSPFSFGTHDHYIANTETTKK